MQIKSPTKILRQAFDIALKVADPMQVMAEHLPAKPPIKAGGRLIILGAGKASARMAEAVEAHWQLNAGGLTDDDNKMVQGLVIVPYGHTRPTKSVEIVEASHPVPDEAGLMASQSILEMAESATENDYVLCLISGGGSALLCAPANGINLEQKQSVNQALLRSGAPISAMNIVRKHLSKIKGGQLAKAAYPAKLTCLMISDVPHDDPAIIASGPCVGDDSTAQEALQILNDNKIEMAPNIVEHLKTSSSVVPTTSHYLDKVEAKVIIAPSQSLHHVGDWATKLGFKVIQLGDSIEGEAKIGG